MNYNYDALVQQTTSSRPKQKCGWKSVYAHNNENFEPIALWMSA